MLALHATDFATAPLGAPRQSARRVLWPRHKAARRTSAKRLGERAEYGRSADQAAGYFKTSFTGSSFESIFIAAARLRSTERWSGASFSSIA